MAQIEQLAFVEIIFKKIYKYKNFQEILKIGSYDVNGLIRHFFEHSQYIGDDLIEGKGVDLFGDGYIFFIHLQKIVKIGKRSLNRG